MTAAVLALATLASCGDKRSEPAGSEIGEALGRAMGAADRVTAPWRCAAPDGPQHAATSLEIAGTRWDIDNYTLRAQGTRDRTVIAAIADAGGAAAPTIAALGRLRSKLVDVDLVLALGGMGASAEELEATLGTVAEGAKYPVIALPGDLESIPALSAALASLRQRGLHVLDGRLIHQIELPVATIALVPGGRGRSRLVSGSDGCAYAVADVNRVYATLTANRALRIVASADAPRQRAGGEATGELVLAPNAGHEIDIVLHGPTTSTATRAVSGGRDARGVALTPGTADATFRLPGPTRPATAGLLTLRAGAWAWKPIADSD